MIHWTLVITLYANYLVFPFVLSQWLYIDFRIWKSKPNGSAGLFLFVYTSIASVPLLSDYVFDLPGVLLPLSKLIGDYFALIHNKCLIL